MRNYEINKVGFVGSRIWSTAIVKMLCGYLEQVNWWERSEYVKEYIYQ